MQPQHTPSTRTIRSVPSSLDWRMRQYHTPAEAQVSALHSHSLVLQALPHQHHPLQASNRPTTPQWLTTRLRLLHLNPLLIARRHLHQKMLVMELVLEPLLCMTSMPRSTAILCKRRSRPSQRRGHTFLDHLLQDRASLVRLVCSVQTLQDQYQVHHRARHHLHHHHLLLP